MADEEGTYDALVIGGGPAGLSAALWLARYRRRVRVFDAADPRNAVTWAVHGYPGLPDVPPDELRRIIRDQARTAGAEFEAAVVERVEGERDDFRATVAGGRTVHARRVLIASGLRDIIPEIPGLTDFYGESIFHCPDCDGPSATGLRVGVIGWGPQIAAVCMWLLTWTDKLAVLTHGHEPALGEAAHEALKRFAIPVRKEVVERIEGTNGCVREVVFHGGAREPFDMLFFHVACGPGSPVAAELRCRADEEGILEVNDEFETSVPGVFAAGDVTPGARLVIRAAYEGTRAAIGIQKSLLPPERRLR